MRESPTFLAEVEAAEARIARRLQNVLIEEATYGRAGNRWLPASVALERRFPNEFGRKTNVAVEVSARVETLDVQTLLASPELISKWSEFEAMLQNSGQVIDGEVRELPAHEDSDGNVAATGGE
jgi:hypothetical protein